MDLERKSSELTTKFDTKKLIRASLINFEFELHIKNGVLKNKSDITKF